MASKEEIDNAIWTLFDARNLVEAIRMIGENIQDTHDDLSFVIQTTARIAMEKIDEVTGGAVLDPPTTEKQRARAVARYEKSRGRQPNAEREQTKTESQPA
jgi:hypothetical protein